MLEQSNPGSTDTVTDRACEGGSSGNRGGSASMPLLTFCYTVLCVMFLHIIHSLWGARGLGKKKVSPVRRGRSGISSGWTSFVLWAASSAHQHCIGRGVTDRKGLCVGVYGWAFRWPVLTTWVDVGSWWTPRYCCVPSRALLCAAHCPSMWCQGSSENILHGRSPGFSDIYYTHTHTHTEW